MCKQFPNVKRDLNEVLSVSSSVVICFFTVSSLARVSNLREYRKGWKQF